MAIFYCDGSCHNDTGLGGWGYIRILKNQQVIHKRYDSYCDTTNNRMELMSVIEAIKSVSNKSTIRIYTDSMYVIMVARKIVSNNFSIPNGDLWLDYVKALRGRSIVFTHVKGHSGITFNELADKLADKGYQLAKAGQCKKDVRRTTVPNKSLFGSIQ